MLACVLLVALAAGTDAFVAPPPRCVEPIHPRIDELVAAGYPDYAKKAAPPVTTLGADMLKPTGAAGLILIPVSLPAIPFQTVSVALSDCVPAVLSTTPVKVCLPSGPPEAVSLNDLHAANFAYAWL